MSIIILPILIVITIGLGTAQGILSARKNKYLGLIIPAALFIIMSIFLLANLGNAFYTVEGFGEFLSGYGGIGIWALILKIGVIYLPVIILLVIYFIVRAVYKHNHPENKEMDKMLAKDLD